MNYQIIKNEIEAYPEIYSGKTPEEVAAIFNTVDRPVLRQRWVSARTLYNELPDAEDVLSRLEAATENTEIPEPIRKMLARVLGWLNDPAGEYPGIDIGAATTQTIVANLAGILTSDQIIAVKSLGYVTISRAEELGLSKVLPGHVMKATEGES